MRQPAWLDNWITFQESQDIELEYSNEQVSEADDVTSVSVIWSGQAGEYGAVQADFKIQEDVVCQWKPHLTPEEGMVIGDLFYYSPAAIFRRDDELFAMIPDIDWLDLNRSTPQYFDYTREDRHFFIGVGNYEKSHHVYHKLTGTPFKLDKRQVLLRFYFVRWGKVSESRDFSPVTSFIWNKFASKRMRDLTISETKSLPELEKYAKYTYDWALNSWKDVVWQEFTIDGEKVGGWVFLVRAAQKPGLGNEESWREKKSIWNQAWFSSLRSAFGAARWGKYWGKTELIEKAMLAKKLALSAPQINGLFPSVYSSDENDDWDGGFWTNSDRKPAGMPDFGHLVDMSWTAHWMLRWYSELERDSALLAYVKAYCDRLLLLQKDDGNFPAWIDIQSGEESDVLSDGPETSMQAWILAELYRQTYQKKYLDAAKRAFRFVQEKVLPEGRWEDFETYFSCSGLWSGKVYHQKEPRSGLYNQCNFSIYWTIEASKALFFSTSEEKYIHFGETLLSELSLYQAIWNPKYMNVPTIGGFTVMTSDDEWNDARQSLFAETYFDFFQLTKHQEYLQRGLSAMQASFYMMYCPENAQAMDLYNGTFSFLDANDYGFEMENAGHGENIDKTGEFSAFDWGNGSACTSLINLLIKSGAVSGERIGEIDDGTKE